MKAEQPVNSSIPCESVPDNDSFNLAKPGDSYLHCWIGTHHCVKVPKTVPPTVTTLSGVSCRLLRCLICIPLHSGGARVAWRISVRFGLSVTLPGIHTRSAVAGPAEEGCWRSP